MRESEFRVLLHDHAGLLGRIAASYEADPALRDDLMQDIAVALWRALPTWRNEASLKSFVARVAHNRGASHVAGQMRRPATGSLDEEHVDLRHGPDTHTELTQDLQRLQVAVRALPLALRQAVTLALEGFSHAEIADTLGVTTNSISVRLNRAKSALKALLGGKP
jgi:RNA polymerase sigma factor (sigma-70 family)